MVGRPHRGRLHGRVRDSIDDGDTWVIERQGDVVATIAIDTWANADLWTADELRTALILHRMITDPAAPDSDSAPA